jgi:hypothetical protein
MGAFKQKVTGRGNRVGLRRSSGPMSAIGREPEVMCSIRAFPLLTRSRHIEIKKTGEAERCSAALTTEVLLSP